MNKIQKQKSFYVYSLINHEGLHFFILFVFINVKKYSKNPHYTFCISLSGNVGNRMRTS